MYRLIGLITITHEVSFLSVEGTLSDLFAFHDHVNLISEWKRSKSEALDSYKRAVTAAIDEAAQRVSGEVKIIARSSYPSGTTILRLTNLATHYSEMEHD